MRRTVKVSFKPRPRLPITTPVKIWMRSLSPSTTLVCTRTVSPTPTSTGFLRNCFDSIRSSMAWFIKADLECWRSGAVESRSPTTAQDSATPSIHYSVLFQQIPSALFRPLLRLFQSPFFNLGVIAGEQHFRNFHPAKLGRPRVLRVLQQTATELFVVRTLIVAQRAGQQPRHRVDDHHRGQ